jgi:general secretion pathway protein D
VPPPAVAAVPTPQSRTAPSKAQAVAPPARKHAAASGPPVSLSLELPASVALNEQFSVKINETGAKNLYSTVFAVKYDPKKLEVLTKEEGSIMKQNGAPTRFQSFASAKKGELWISLSRVDVAEGASGNGVLATVTFKAIGKGQAALSFANTNFTNKAEEVFTVTPFNTVVEVK